MEFTVGEFTITKYDSKDEEQRHLKYVLSEDYDFTKYITKKIDERLKEESNTIFNSSYLVKYKNDYVGYIRIEEVINGSVKLQYAISPEYRNNHLGSRILDSISNYILEHYKEITKLKLVIERSNYASIKTAINANYKEEKKDDFYISFGKER